jgi:Plasmid encoded RepA protein
LTAAAIRRKQDSGEDHAMNDEPKPLAVTVDELRKRAEAKQPKPLTDAQRKLLEHSANIFGELATKKDAAYLPRELVQVTLPHKNPGNVQQWKRTNGNLTVGIQPGQNFTTGESHGYPYGSIPRLLLFWITTEAIRKKSRRLELGHSLSGFMADLGLSAYTGRGKRGDAKRLRNQMERLFNASISFVSTGERGDDDTHTSWLNMHVAPRGELWWSRRDPDQTALWGSWIELGEDFFAAITAFPVPADLRALRALKRSPLALDLYAWLTYEAWRAHRCGKPRFENWEQLHAHLGGEYGRLDHFRTKAKAALAKIKTVYPGLKLGDRQGGIQLLPESWPAIRPKNLTIDGVCKGL